MLDNIVIRDFIKEDYSLVKEIWLKLKMDKPERKDDLFRIEETIKHGGRLLVMETKTEKEIVATAWLTTDFRRLYLHHFAVIEKFQNIGLGKMLMKYCIEFAEQLKMQLKLEVAKDNKKAVKLYKSFNLEILQDYLILIKR